MPGFARPVRMVAKSSLATSIAFSIFSSASRRVSSITVAPSSRHVLGRGCASPGARSAGALPGRDQRADPLTPHGACDVPVLLHTEHDHGQLVVHTQAE